LRERFDFSSISKLILEHRTANSFTYADYYSELFQYAFIKKVTEPEESELSKIINGERNVPKEIIRFYPSSKVSEAHEDLKDGVNTLLTQVFDEAGMVESIYNLLMNDASISKATRETIAKNKETPVSFIADCIIAGINRPFVSRKKGKANATPKAKFHLSDYLIDYHYVSVNKVFLGREKELEKVHQLLQDEHCVLLQGIGGIGKSELAKQYGKQFKKSYSHVIFLRYSENLRQTISELKFVDDEKDMSEEELFENHYRFFKQLGEDTLVVLDNFDQVPEQDELFDEFTSLSFQILVTTRFKIAGMCYYSIKEIDSLEALTEIFNAHAPKSKSDIKTVQEIIKEVHQHTLAVEMSAKTMMATGLTAKQLLKTLQRDRLLLENTNQIRITKDSLTKKERSLHHLESLFKIQSFSDDEKDILFYMLAMPEKGINKDYFRKYCKLDDCNMINRLIEYGWIEEEIETSYISMHPFIREAIAQLEKPSLLKLSSVFHGIIDDMEEHGMKLQTPREEMTEVLDEMFQKLDEVARTEDPSSQINYEALQELFAHVPREKAEEAVNTLAETPFHEADGSTLPEDNILSLFFKQMADELSTTLDDMEKEGFRFADDSMSEEESMAFFKKLEQKSRQKVQ